MKDFKSRRKGEGDAESAFKCTSSPRSKVGHSLHQPQCGPPRLAGTWLESLPGWNPDLPEGGES